MIYYEALDNRLQQDLFNAKVVSGMFDGSEHFAIAATVRLREKYKFTKNKK